MHVTIKDIFVIIFFLISVIWKVDDAVGATCVHGFGGAWGMIAVGIFAAKDELEGFSKHNGILHGEWCIITFNYLTHNYIKLPH